jgi:hypothetical protein
MFITETHALTQINYCTRKAAAQGEKAAPCDSSQNTVLFRPGVRSVRGATTVRVVHQFARTPVARHSVRAPHNICNAMSSSS